MGANRRRGTAWFALALVVGMLLGAFGATPVLAQCMLGGIGTINTTTPVPLPRDQPHTADVAVTLSGAITGEGINFTVDPGLYFHLTSSVSFGDAVAAEGILAIGADGGDVCYDGLAAASITNAAADGIGLEMTTTGAGTATVRSAHNITAGFDAISVITGDGAAEVTITGGLLNGDDSGSAGIYVETLTGAAGVTMTGGSIGTAITATGGYGIYVDAGGDTTIALGSAAAIHADGPAIEAAAFGDVMITSAAALESIFSTGISATAVDGDISILSTGAIVSGGIGLSDGGIVAGVLGTGDVHIGSATSRIGAITAEYLGIEAAAMDGDIEIFTGGTIEAVLGVGAFHDGEGDMLIDTAGDINALGVGIGAFHIGTAGDVVVRTAAGTTINLTDPGASAGISAARQIFVGTATGSITIDNRADILVPSSAVGFGIQAAVCSCTDGTVDITNRGDIVAQTGIAAVGSGTVTIDHLAGTITSTAAGGVGIVAAAEDALLQPTPELNINVGSGASILAETGILIADVSGAPGGFNPTNITIGGRVEGTGGTALELSLGEDVLTLQPGYEIVGAVMGQDSDDTLVLGGDGGSDTFDLDAFGTQFTSFQDFRKRGTSTWTVTGSGSFFTETIVEAGRLNVTGAAMHFANVVVAAGAVLGGNGDIDDGKLSGTLAPGNSIGTINATKFEFLAGSTYEVEVNAAGDSDLLITANGAIIDPTASVVVLPEAGTYAATQTYRIIDSTIVLGTFDPSVTSPPLLSATLSYDPLGVLLTLVRNTTAVGSLGLTPNQKATGVAIDAMGFNAPYLGEIIAATDIPGLLDALSGDGYASIKGALLEDSRYLREAMLQRLDAARDAVPAVTASGYAAATAVGDPAKGIDAWARAYGGRGTIDTDGNAAATDHAAGGLIAGLDGASADLRGGGILSYGQSGFAIPTRQMTGSSHNFSIGGYGGYEAGAWSLSGGAAFTHYDVSTTRVATFPGVNDTFAARYTASTIQAFGEAGYTVDLGAFEATPFAGLAYARVSNNAFTETGTGAGALTVAATASDAPFTTLGVKVAHGFAAGDGVLVKAKGSVAWRHAIAGLPASVNAFAGGPQFTVAGAPLASDALSLTAGVDVDLSAATALSLGYSGEFGFNSRSHALTATYAGSF